MATEFIERYEANLFLQQDPADPYEFLTCTGIGNITIPKGAATIKYKQDLKRSGRLVAAGKIQTVADAPTMSITRPLESVHNYLHEITCPFNARVNWACRGTRTLFTNYQLGALLYDSLFTTGTIETPGAGGEGDNERVNTTGELSATRFTYVYPLAGAKSTMISTTDVYAIAVVPSECASKCGDKIGLGQKVWLGLEYTSYTVGYLLFSDDYAATWTVPVWHPFVAGGDISSIVIVDGQTGYRVICARGSTIPGEHAEISYSDDEGDTGTDVYVGTVDGQTIQMLFKDVKGRIWAAATDGDIYVSLDNGVTWTETGSSATGEDLYDICFYDEYTGFAVGDNNAFLVTTNGGTTWTLVTGPSAGDNLVSCAVNYAGHIYVTNDDAEVWRSVDDGDTWELMLDMAGTMPQIRFDDDFRYFGYLVSDSAVPVGMVYRSEDAGNTWDAIGVATTDYANDGLHCLAVCDPNMLYAGGIAAGPLSCVVKFERES